MFRRKNKEDAFTGVPEERDPDAIFESGMVCEKENSFEAAFVRFKEAAKLRHKEAQCKVGDYLYSGLGVTLNEKEAKKYYKRASNQRHGDACFKLARIYGKEGNFEKEVMCYLGVIWSHSIYSSTVYLEKDIAEAAYRLSVCYKEGRGVSKDEKRSLELCEKAAEKGHHVAGEVCRDVFYELTKGTSVEEARTKAMDRRFQWGQATTPGAERTYPVVRNQVFVVDSPEAVGVDRVPIAKQEIRMS